MTDFNILNKALKVAWIPRIYQLLRGQYLKVLRCNAQKVTRKKEPFPADMCTT